MCTDKLQFGALARKRPKSFPWGKLASEARLMRAFGHEMSKEKSSVQLLLTSKLGAPRCAVLEPVVSSVIKIKIHPLRPEEGTLAPGIRRDGCCLGLGTAVVRQLTQLHAQSLGNIKQGFNIQGDLPGLVFADAGPALVDQVRQLLKGQALGLAEGTDAAAGVLGDLAHNDILKFRINIHFSRS